MKVQKVIVDEESKRYLFAFWEIRGNDQIKTPRNKINYTIVWLQLEGTWLLYPASGVSLNPQIITL